MQPSLGDKRTKSQKKKNCSTADFEGHFTIEQISISSYAFIEQRKYYMCTFASVYGGQRDMQKQTN